MPTSKTILRLIALLSFTAVLVALLSQHVFDMRPCAWCVFQRLIYIVIGVVAWFGSLGAGVPLLRRLTALTTLLLSAGGILAAWYQYTVAAKLFSCDQTFADRFMVQSGLDASLPWLFGIFASCLDARVNLLGVEYAIWSLTLFSLLTLASAFVVLKRQ